jgi:hypothetical protein
VAVAETKSAPQRPESKTSPQFPFGKMRHFHNIEDFPNALLEQVAFPE